MNSPRQPEDARQEFELAPEDARQEFELALGKGLALSDLTDSCVRMIRNALPFANAGLDTYLAALWKADPLPRNAQRDAVRAGVTL
jgi:hypothetical protein